MRNKYSCKSEFVWNVHIQVMLKVISFSILNMDEQLLRHGCQRHSFWNSQVDSQMCTFPDQMNWQFVQIRASKLRSKLRVLDTDDVKQKTSLFSVHGKIYLVLFHAFCSFVLEYVICVRYKKYIPKLLAILSTHLLHEFIVNVKPAWIDRVGKPYNIICLSFNFLENIFCQWNMRV